MANPAWYPIESGSLRKKEPADYKTILNWILRWLYCVWGCLKGFRTLSDWFWILPRLYLWNNSWKHIKKITSLYFTTGFPSRDRKFLPLPFTMPTFIDLGLSGRCLRVSGRCLEVVWVTLSTSWWVIIPNRLTKLCLISWFLYPQWSWIGHWVPYFGFR